MIFIHCFMVENTKQKREKERREASRNPFGNSRESTSPRDNKAEEIYVYWLIILIGIYCQLDIIFIKRN